MIVDQALLQHCKAITPDLYTNTDIISVLDLTLLDPSASRESIQKLGADAKKHSVAAVCVLPEHLKFLPIDTAVKKAAVLGVSPTFVSKFTV